LTNNYHGLIWADWKLVKIGGYTGLVVEHGTWFYIHAMYCYTLILMSTAILVFTLTQFQQHYQVLLAAIFAPLIGLATNLFSLSPLNPYPWLDITSLGFLFGICILDRGILQYGILNRLPVVRDNVVEQLSDPVLVIDHAGTIIDANLAAVAAWPIPKGILFTPINNIVLKLPLENLQRTQSNSELTINHRAYEVSSTPLDSSNAQSDLALVFRDITERQEAQRKLREMTDELERMAHTDGLTNLFNRRYFMQRLNEEFERVRRHGSVLSVLIFDLDHFKKVNDSYGHDVGDAVLVSVSAVANQVKRVTDIACRLGGEEFALLLPETSKDGAVKLANRLRKGIELYPYKDLVGFPLAVSASIGVATACQQGNAPEAILKVADRALYKAKNGGRNMVCFGID
ncbi:MAG: diguanylate cyclase, partial [Gammaproteobacteria bacterium]|nr:diguanylate cyclase [Gammaproteobacteria bacterium]